MSPVRNKTDYVLDAAHMVLTRDAFGKIHMKCGNETCSDVEPIRIYSLTAPSRYIVFLDSDGGEIGMIRDMKELPAESADLLTEELEMRYFTAHVLKILSVNSRFGVTTWELETDRGECVIHVKDRNDIRRLPGNRIVLTDINGVKYEISDTTSLDRRSCDLLETEA